MDILYLLASEADDTRRSITLLIFALLFVSFALMAITVWYWRYTSPKRYMVPAVAKTQNKQAPRRAMGDGAPYRKTNQMPTQTVDFDQAIAVAENRERLDG